MTSLPDQHQQRQDSLDAQLRDVEQWIRDNSKLPYEEFSPLQKMRIATRLGCYDAADFFNELVA